jgi:hypothetical protein
VADSNFDLWLEFEHLEPREGDDPEDDFFNMQITVHGGKKYALNVWTYKVLGRMVQDCRESGECLEGAYLPPPDLFVQRLDRSLLERIVADLITQGELKKEWEIPAPADGELRRVTGQGR